MKANSDQAITSKSEIKISRCIDTENKLCGTVNIRLRKDLNFCVPDIMNGLQAVYADRGYSITCFSLCLVKRSRMQVHFNLAH